MLQFLVGNISSRGTVDIRGGTVTAGNIDVHSDELNVAAGTVRIESKNTLAVGNIFANHGVTNGDAGSVTLISKGTSFQVGAVAGANRSGTINLSVAQVGDGGTLSITNQSGINIVVAPNLSTVDGDGANLTLDAVLNTLNLTAFGSAINVSATGSNDHNGGNIFLRYGTTMTTSGIALTTNGTGANGHGGDVTIQNFNGDVNFGGGFGNFNGVSTSANSASNYGSLTVNAGNDINFTGSSSNIRNLSFTALNDVVIGSTGVNNFLNLTASAGHDVGLIAAYSTFNNMTLTATHTVVACCGPRRNKSYC